MARATIKFKATGVGGGKGGTNRPNRPYGPKIARSGNGRVKSYGRSKA